MVTNLQSRLGDETVNDFLLWGRERPGTTVDDVEAVSKAFAAELSERNIKERPNAALYQEWIERNPIAQKLNLASDDEVALMLITHIRLSCGGNSELEAAYIDEARKLNAIGASQPNPDNDALKRALQDSLRANATNLSAFFGWA